LILVRHLGHGEKKSQNPRVTYVAPTFCADFVGIDFVKKIFPRALAEPFVPANRVARFVLAQYTKMGEMYQIAT
jgi:hypothetical protein